MLWRLLGRRAASRAEGLGSLEDSVWIETGKLHILGMFWRRMDGEGHGEVNSTSGIQA
jgi:hypothetical protein